MTTAEKNRTRDKLHGVLKKEIPGYAVEGLSAVGDLVVYFWDGYPQYSCTRMPIYVCCDGSDRAPLQNIPISHTGLSVSGLLPGMSIAEILQREFDSVAWDKLSPGDRCSYRNCKGRPRVHSGIIDRMSKQFYLDLNTNCAPIREMATRKYLDSPVITIRTTKRSILCKFEPIGCIVMPTQNHFFSRWCTKDKVDMPKPFSHFDSLVKETVDGCNGLLDKCHPDFHVSVLFYDVFLL